MALAAQRIQDQAVLAMPVPVVRSLAHLIQPVWNLS